jgi:hypothetical protein
MPPITARSSPGLRGPSRSANTTTAFQLWENRSNASRAWQSATNVRYEGLPDLLGQVGGLLRGRTVLDCVNAVVPPDATLDTGDARRWPG